MNTNNQNQLTELLNIKNNGILYNFCRFGNKEGVEFLLNNTSIDINEFYDDGVSDTYTPLMGAVTSRNITIVALLLNNKNIDINKYTDDCDAYKVNALTLCNNLNCLKILLNHKDILNINDQIYNGENILLKWARSYFNNRKLLDYVISNYEINDNIKIELKKILNKNISDCTYKNGAYGNMYTTDINDTLLILN